MEKLIFPEPPPRSPILYHPAPANAGRRAERDFQRWKRGGQWIANGGPGCYWRVASMKSAFSTIQPSPEPGTPWHEVAGMESSLWGKEEKQP